MISFVKGIAETIQKDWIVDKMNKIIEVVSNLIFSVLSCFVYDKAKIVISNTVDKKRQDKIKNWISNFFADHVEAVFDSSQFENYLKYNKPFDTIAK